MRAAWQEEDDATRPGGAALGDEDPHLPDRGGPPVGCQARGNRGGGGGGSPPLLGDRPGEMVGGGEEAALVLDEPTREGTRRDGCQRPRPARTLLTRSSGRPRSRAVG